VRCYDVFGQCLLRESCPRPAATLATALARCELWPAAPLDILRGSCAKSDLLHQVVEGNWPAVQELRGQIDFWRRPAEANQPSSFPGQEEWKQWSAWSGFLASRAPKVAGAKTAAQPSAEEGDLARERRGLRGFRRVLTPDEQREIAQRKSWQHPLIEQISKDGFSLIAEFEASLQGEAYDDACQTAMTADPQAALGLLPWAKDPQLSLTFPTAVALAMQTHPGMRQMMLDKFAAPGLVRVRQAKATGDVAALRAATVHLVGTQAASEAQPLLGRPGLSGRRLPSGGGAFSAGRWPMLRPMCASRSRRCCGWPVRCRAVTSVRNPTSRSTLAARGSLPMNSSKSWPATWRAAGGLAR